jgi:hypothetical protein
MFIFVWPLIRGLEQIFKVLFNANELIFFAFGKY